MGFVFTGRVQIPKSRSTPGGVLIGLDLDVCYADGVISPWAEEVLQAFGNSYCEVSPSGTGLRVFLTVLEVPPSVPIIFVPQPVEGPKKPQIQVFGCGAAQYVTVTGDQLEGSADEPLPADSLQWLIDRYQAQPEPGPANLPDGRGVAPTSQELRRAMKASSSPRIATLVDGDWESLGHKSASEGFHELAIRVLDTAQGHVKAAAAYLIQDTAYGHGEVESLDPARYGREGWVLTDLCRLAGKGQAQVERVFDDDFDASNWEPPKSNTSPEAPWLLQAAEFVSSRGQTGFLYRGLLPARGLAQIFGPPGSGKTAAVLSLAVSVAVGADWHGHRLKRRGRVFYVAGEGLDGLGRRLQAQLRAIDPLVPLKELKLHLSTRAAQLTVRENRQRWVREIQSVAEAWPDDPPALIVLDTQIRNFGPGDENATEDMSRFVAEVDELGRQTGALVLLIHHSGHAEKGRGRGSSVLDGALDAILEIARPEEGRRVFITTRKAKDWEPAERIEGRLHSQQVGVDEEGDPLTAVTYLQTPLEASELFQGEFAATPLEADARALLTAVKGLNGESISKLRLAEKIDRSPQVVRRVLRRLLKEGLIEVGGTRSTPTYCVSVEGEKQLAFFGC